MEYFNRMLHILLKLYFSIYLLASLTAKIKELRKGRKVIFLYSLAKIARKVAKPPSLANLKLKKTLRLCEIKKKT